MRAARAAAATGPPTAASGASTASSRSAHGCRSCTSAGSRPTPSRAGRGGAPADRGRVGEGGDRDRRDRAATSTSSTSARHRRAVRRRLLGVDRERASAATRASRATPTASTPRCSSAAATACCAAPRGRRDPRVARATFRNWDLPQRRQIFAGLPLRLRTRDGIRSTAEAATTAAITIDAASGRRAERSLADDVLDGLTRPFKELPPKHFYDARGARAVRPDRELPEYYPTRAERAILDRARAEIVADDRRRPSSSSWARARRRRRACCSTRCTAPARCAATCPST